jgi:FkbM family methyltransferase
MAWSMWKQNAVVLFLVLASANASGGEPHGSKHPTVLINAVRLECECLVEQDGGGACRAGKELIVEVHLSGVIPGYCDGFVYELAVEELSLTAENPKRTEEPRRVVQVFSSGMNFLDVRVPGRGLFAMQDQDQMVPGLGKRQFKGSYLDQNHKISQDDEGVDAWGPLVVLDDSDALMLLVAVRDIHQGLSAGEALLGERLFRIPFIHCREPGALGPEHVEEGVLHIGAHLGQEAFSYFSKVGKHVVHIECNPALLPSLRKNVACMGHTAIQACLWHTAGEHQELHMTSNGGLSASLIGNLTHTARSDWHTTNSGSISVSTDTWSTLLSKHPVLSDPVYNKLVVDTQGAEYEILWSMAQSHGLGRFAQILVECSNKAYYAGQKLQPAVEQLLVSNGFVNARGEYPMHGDVLYLNVKYQRGSSSPVGGARRMQTHEGESESDGGRETRGGGSGGGGTSSTEL